MYGRSFSLKACTRSEAAQVPFLYCTRTILGSRLDSKWDRYDQYHLFSYPETHRLISSKAAQTATVRAQATPPTSDGSERSKIRPVRSGTNSPKPDGNEPPETRSQLSGPGAKSPKSDGSELSTIKSIRSEAKSFLIRKRESLVGVPVQRMSEPPSHLQRSTITNTERATFSKIFQDLVKDSAAPTISRLTSEELARRDTAAQEAKELKALSDTIIPIYREAIEDYETRRKVQENQRHVLPPRLMDRLPQSLQQAAKQSDFFFNNARQTPMRRQKGQRTPADYFARPGLFEEHPQRERAKSTRAETTISVSQVVQEMCLRELEETAFRFDQVIGMPDGDLKIWEICEDRIFPLIRLLQPGENASTLAPKASKKQKSPPTRSPPLKVPNYVPPLAVVSRLYPTSINLAVNLLVQNFPTSLILPNLLPHIKSLGQISYVLGASRKLYNLLLNLHWRVYSDVTGMDKLLTEMLDSGVGFDRRTLQVLYSVSGGRRRELGPRGKQSREMSRAIAQEEGLGQDKRPYGERARSEAWWNLEVVRNCMERLFSFWQGVISENIAEMQQTSKDEKENEKEREALEATVLRSRAETSQGENPDSTAVPPTTTRQAVQQQAVGVWHDEEQAPAAAAAA
ncbi:MAG: hypothetical protein Q9160_000251 [Pyrenula sp. 1 TL-2023]